MNVNRFTVGVVIVLTVLAAAIGFQPASGAVENARGQYPWK